MKAMDNRKITEDPNGNGNRGLPKLQDIFCQQGQNSDGGMDCPDLEFVYADSDSYANEIAELYSYTEHPEFQLNIKAFEDQMEMYGLRPSWEEQSSEQKISIITNLLDQLEVSNKVLRMKAARCFLYLAQGCWAEMQLDKEQQACTKENVYLLYQCGVFHAFVDLLNIEIDNSATAMHKLAANLADSTDLRVILSVLYIIAEVIRCVSEEDSSEWHTLKEAFQHEISHPIGDELLTVKLFGMVTRFCSGSAPHFPMRKVLLLLWKIILVSLGGINVLRELKWKYREQAGLTVLEEDTIEVVRTMRASSPPANAADRLEAQKQNQKRNNRPFHRSLMKQSSLDESLSIEFEQADEEMREFKQQQVKEDTDRPIPQPPSPHPPTPIPAKGLPWRPKARQRDLDTFLENARIKFVGFPLQGDRKSLFGLPQPILEGVRVLKQHIHTSLAEIQMQQGENIAKSSISVTEPPIPLTPTETLYQGLLPNLPQYMMALIEILLAAAPISKPKTGCINIMVDVFPEEEIGLPITLLQSLGTDLIRHNEIVVKAVSAILLLLLKHFKLNHVYQFEFMSQHLVSADCIPLILMFFNQNIMAYVGCKNVIPILDFPACVIGDQPDLTTESFEIGDSQLYSWRNMFSCINLLRILNKLTKWKHCRIMILLVFKSAPILKRALKVRHAMMQLYVLKLLKMQTKYLGRQWRKSNMETMSAIYQKVRHRLIDDWAYGNDLDGRPWDFQAEECALRTSVDRFNTQRYITNSLDPDFEPLDTCITSVLGSLNNIELTEEFKQHYDLWLQQEVFQTSVNWDEVLNYSYM